MKLRIKINRHRLCPNDTTTPQHPALTQIQPIAPCPAYALWRQDFRVLQDAGFGSRCPACTWLDVDLSSDWQASLTRMVGQLQRTWRLHQLPLPSHLHWQNSYHSLRQGRTGTLWAHFPDSPSLLPSWTLWPDTQRWMEATATGPVPSMALEFPSLPIHHHLSVLIRPWQNHPLVTALPSLLCGSVIIVQERPRAYYRKLHRKCHVRMSRGCPCIEEPHLDTGIIFIHTSFFSYTDSTFSYVKLIGMLCSGSSLHVERETLHLDHSQWQILCAIVYLGTGMSSGWNKS